MISMKKNIIKPLVLILVFVLLLATTISLARAWYVKVSKIGKIDADTKDISIVYKINDSKEINQLDYTITDLAFFDIDNYYDSSTKTGEDEINYLNNMAVCMKIDLENSSSDIVDLTISFSSEPRENKVEEIVASRAYVQGVLSAEPMTFAKSENVTKIEDYLPKDEEGNVIKNNSQLVVEDLEIDGKTTIYVYLFGVQEIDSASNDLFIDDSYSFNLTISAIGSTSNPEVVTD